MDETRRLEQTAVDTIRPLAMDAVGYCLWQKFLRFDPDDPIWPNRDRFVLSMGHASMLLYSLLHLTDGLRGNGGTAPPGRPVSGRRVRGLLRPGRRVVE